MIMTQQQVGVECQQVVITWKSEVVHTCPNSDKLSSHPEWWRYKKPNCSDGGAQEICESSYMQHWLKLQVSELGSAEQGLF